MDEKKKLKVTKEEGEEEGVGTELCPKCGNEMIWEDKKKICPDCDTAIDFFGDEDDSKDD